MDNTDGGLYVRASYWYCSHQGRLEDGRVSLASLLYLGGLDMKNENENVNDSMQLSFKIFILEQLFFCFGIKMNRVQGQGTGFENDPWLEPFHALLRFSAFTVTKINRKSACDYD